MNADKNQMTEQIRGAGEAYVKAVVAAKFRWRQRDQFWKDRTASRSYTKLFQAIRKSVGEDLRFEFPMWDLCGATADSIRRKRKPNIVQFVENFTVQVEAILHALSHQDWIGCAPLERRFSDFPAFLDFGDFAILNPGRSLRTRPTKLFEQFRRLLTKHLGISFDPLLRTRDSYLRLDSHYYNKSGNYIPGRPQFVVKLSRGDAFSNHRQFESIAARYLPLLGFCQLEYDLAGSILESGITGPHSVLPDGKTWMPPGLLEVPRVALGINRLNGIVDWWGLRMRRYESDMGAGYKWRRLRKIWKLRAKPILAIQSLGAPPAVVKSINDAIELVSRSRHPAIGNLLIDSIIATETILNPFGARREMGERLPLIVSALIGGDAKQRQDAYKSARRMYQARNVAVHRADSAKPEEGDPTGKDAFRVFTICLKTICDWFFRRLKQGMQCTAEELDAFFLQLVIR